MKREDIIKASFEYKREIELIEGNFHNNIINKIVKYD